MTRGLKMAGVCRTCKALRLNSTLKNCFGPSFIPSKFKYVMPAAFISSFSFIGYRYSSRDRTSGGILWQRSRCVLEDFSVFCKGLRPYRSTAFQFQRGQTKPGAGKIKAKLEQMKEMVGFIQSRVSHSKRCVAGGGVGGRGGV